MTLLWLQLTSKVGAFLVFCTKQVKCVDPSFPSATFSSFQICLFLLKRKISHNQILYVFSLKSQSSQPLFSFQKEIPLISWLNQRKIPKPILRWQLRPSRVHNSDSANNNCSRRSTQRQFLRNAGQFPRRASSLRTVRETAGKQLEERQSDWAYSKPVVILDIIWNFAFVVVVALTLSRNKDSNMLCNAICVCVEHRRRRRKGVGFGVEDGGIESDGI